jgi:hypothetical protein
MRVTFYFLHATLRLFMYGPVGVYRNPTISYIKIRSGSYILPSNCRMTTQSPDVQNGKSSHCQHVSYGNGKFWLC